VKKGFFGVCALALIAAGAGCSGNGGAGGSADALTGTSEEVLTQVLEAAPALLPAGESLPAGAAAPVTATDAGQMLGLTEADFGTYVSDATAAQPLIGSFAHEVAVVRLKDGADAAQVKALIAAGFDAGKWICVFPELAAVVESGGYLLLVASKAAAVTALVQAFTDLAGGHTGAVDEFYTAG
jgi:hypothetical protein